MLHLFASLVENVEIHFREAEGIKIDTENKKVYCNTLGVVENCHFLKVTSVEILLFKSFFGYKMLCFLWEDAKHGNNITEY